MEDWSRAPEEILGLVADLRENGFAVRRSRIGDSFNQTVDLWDGGEEVAVRISADRGRWYLELGPAGDDDLFSPDVWGACLDDHPIGTETWSVDERVEFIHHRAFEAVRAARHDPSLVERLRRARTTRAYARLGRPPAVD